MFANQTFVKMGSAVRSANFRVQMTAERWETGSEYHLVDFPKNVASKHPWEAYEHHLYGSGRDAIVSLLLHGAEHCGWTSLHVPDYFCQEVIRAMATCGLQLRLYPDSPRSSLIEAESAAPGQVWFVVNYFGLRGVEATAGLQRRGAILIEDHTHAPWSAWAFGSHAQYCVASLRKSIPVPDGGVLWSPEGRRLPLAPVQTEQHREAADRKFAAMAMKRAYLEGEPVEKESFRAIQLSAEAAFDGNRVPSAISDASKDILNCVPISEWEQTRGANFECIAAGLAELPGVSVLSAHVRDSSPFSAFLIFDTHALREAVRSSLVAARIYPAVLWSLQDQHRGTKDALSLSERSLSLHCDGRYSLSDIGRIVHVVRQAISRHL